MRDFLRPTCSPAREIYDAFHAEARRRDGRAFEEWVSSEREAVFAAAVRQCRGLSLQPPTMDQVIAAEQRAYGSADYGSKWALGVADAIRQTNGLRSFDFSGLRKAAS